MGDRVSFQGRGPINIALYSQPENLQRLGNSSQLELSIDVNSISQIDYESDGGGEYDAQSAVTGVKAGINILAWSAVSIAIGHRGNLRAVPAIAQVDEPHVAYGGALVLFTYNPDGAQTLTVASNLTAHQTSHAYVVGDFVKDAGSNGHAYECTVAGTSAGSAPTWKTDGTNTTDGTVTWADRGTVSSLVKNTDYTVGRSGITILDSGSIPDGLPIKVGYTPVAGQQIIDALQNSGFEYKMVFDGMNMAKSNRPCTIVLHRVKFTPTTGTGFISENYGEMPMSASILKDPNIDASIQSPYYEIRWQDV